MGSSSSSRRGTGGGRKPPLVRCQCGRMHRSWNPYKVCNACVRERKSREHDELAARVRELERRRLRPTAEERAQDLARFAAIHERWLAKQSLDHPWRVERERGGAYCEPPASTTNAGEPASVEGPSVNPLERKAIAQ